MPQTETKPFPQNLLTQPHVTLIAQKIKAWNIATFSKIGHKHTMADVTGLQDTIEGLSQAVDDTDEVLTFGGIVTGDITIKEQSAMGGTLGAVVWSETHHTFVFKTANGDYYAGWAGSKPYLSDKADRIFICDGKTYVRQDNNLVATGGSAVLTGTCTTAASTVEKAVTLDAGQNIPAAPYNGLEIVVKFSNTNSADSPKLKVGSWGATLIGYMGSTITSSYKDRAGYKDGYIRYMWLGDKWWFAGWSQDANTTYTAMTYNGNNGHLDVGTSTTSMVVSPKVLTSFVEDKVNEKVSTLYRPMGSCTSEFLKNLPLTIKTGDKWALPNGSVYNITDELTTTDNFVEGAGKTYPAGTNVVLVEPSEGVRKWDVLAGSIDLSGYYDKSQEVVVGFVDADLGLRYCQAKNGMVTVHKLFTAATEEEVITEIKTNLS